MESGVNFKKERQAPPPPPDDAKYMHVSDSLEVSELSMALKNKDEKTAKDLGVKIARENYPELEIEDVKVEAVEGRVYLKLYCKGNTAPTRVRVASPEEFGLNKDSTKE